MHNKPIVVFNVEGFFDAFLGMVEGFVEQGFVEEGMRGIVKEVKTAEEVVKAIEEYTPPEGRMKLEWGQEK
jgi:predicted Rossmann-fold nucleotide-binding protein